MIPVQLIVAFFTIYYTVIAVCGMWHRKEKNLAPPKSRFAVVILPIMKKWCWRIFWKT